MWERGRSHKTREQCLGSLERLCFVCEIKFKRSLCHVLGQCCKEKKAGASNKKRRLERRGDPASIFLNPSAHFQENYWSCQNVKMCSCRRVSHARHVCLTLRSTSHVINVSVDVNCPNRSTNHRVYQELVNRNKILKTMLTSSSSLSLPSPPRFSNKFSRSAFPTILELSSKLHSRHCLHSSNTAL